MARRPVPPAEPAGDRIHKLLAAAGVGSRREIEGWITSGRVKVNGELAQVGQKVSERDRIEVDGQHVRLAVQRHADVIVLNKATGIVCSRHDPEGRATVFDDLPALRHGRWVSVGRLDIMTSGLLLLTNDGALANRLMHPSTGLDREYAVRVSERLGDAVLKQLCEGVDVEGEQMRFSDIRYYDGSGRNFWYHVVLMEGRNREVRRLFEAVGATVSRLKRVRYGPVILPSWLRNGHWALLQTDDVRSLYKLLGMKYPKPPRQKGRLGRLARTTCLLPYPKLSG